MFVQAQRLLRAAFLHEAPAAATTGDKGARVQPSLRQRNSQADLIAACIVKWQVHNSLTTGRAAASGVVLLRLIHCFAHNVGSTK